MHPSAGDAPVTHRATRTSERLRPWVIMRGVNIADMAVETARTRLGQVLGALVAVGVAAPLLRRRRRG